MKFSVIVPTYNSESYLPMCMDSVLAQTYANWELVIVNDGSTDQSGCLADRYAKTDARIKVIHKDNGGQLQARLDGLSKSDGDYILFLDSDDCWRRDCLKKLYDKIIKYEPDVIFFPAKKVYDSLSREQLIGAAGDHEYWLDKQEVYETLISDVKYNSMCLKAWKRELFEGDTTDYKKFTGACWGEDKAQLLYPITKAQRILYIPEELYYYRCNPSSVIQNTATQGIPGMISNHVFELVYDYMHQWNMVNAQMKEAIAVCYLRNFLSVYFKLRKQCRGNALKNQFKSYPWEQILCREAFRYAYSQKLNPKEKLKLFVARYLRIL